MLLSKASLRLAAFAASASLASCAFAAVAGDTYVLKIDHTQNGVFTPVDESFGAVLNNGDPAYYHSGGAGDIARIYWKLDDPSVPTTPELYRIQWWDPGPAGFNTQFQPIESQYDGLSETYPIDSNIPWQGQYGTNHQYISTANDAGIGAWNSTGPGPHAPAGYAPKADGATGVYMWLTRGSELYVKWDFGFYDTVNNPLQRVWSDLKLTEVSPIPGDANRDFSVNFADLLTLAQNYGKAGGWSKGDFNGDGSVNFADLLLLAQHYGQSVPSGIVPAGAATPALASVPEPAGLGLVALAAAAMFRPRRVSSL